MSLNWLVNAWNETRKIGIEITEEHGKSTLKKLVPTEAWNDLQFSEKALLWTHTVHFPNKDGQDVFWFVAASGTLIDRYFAYDAEDKRKWMRWDDILFTEDNGDIEWIISHPAEPQGVIYYWDCLQKLSQIRQAFRDALMALKLPVDKLVLAMSPNPGEQEVFEVCLGESIKASAQITIELPSHDITKKALFEGLSFGMNKMRIGGRPAFMEIDVMLVTAVETLANSWACDGVDKELVTLYIVGDLCHKVATIITGPNWHDGPAECKNWRLFFPRSHPYQILLQGMNEHPPKTVTLQKLEQAIRSQKAAFIDCVLTLCVDKLAQGVMGATWNGANFTGCESIQTAYMGGKSADRTGLRADFQTFLNNNCPLGFLSAEFENVLEALVDNQTVKTKVYVVRSSSFAVHHSGSLDSGFAFEDRFEVATTFPALRETYDRLKEIGNHF